MRINHSKKPVRTLCFEDAAAFNHALDTDKRLQNGMQELAEQIPYITEADYIAGILRLFRNAGVKAISSGIPDVAALAKEKLIKCCWKKQKKKNNSLHRREPNR